MSKPIAQTVTCPRCGTENRAAANFCKRCALLLADCCPRCHHDLPDDADYCDNCAYPLTLWEQETWPRPESLPLSERPEPQQEEVEPEPSTQAVAAEAEADPESGPLSIAERFLPDELASKLQAARHSSAMVGERRIVTILFCDVAGSTATAGRMDPEEWTEIINGAFEYMIGPVYKYEGTVARLMGDAILAFFGAPIAHEDDVERALMAGLEIVSGIESYCQKVKEEHGVDFDVRVGINTGHVVVGAVGSDMRMEYTAMGDAINLASRMEQTAEPGTVQVAENTHKLVGPLFDFEDLGRILVKGKSEPVNVYRVLARKRRATQLGSIAGRQTPLIGRDKEWETLCSVLDGLSQGVGQVVCIIGEVGLGKSRLVAEMKAVWDETPSLHERGRWSRSQGVSYDQHPYGQFQQHVQQLFSISERDSVETVLAKIDRGYFFLTPAQLERARRVMQILLSVRTESDAAEIEGEAFKAELYESMFEASIARSQVGPLVLSVEDLQWADAPSVEILLHLLPQVQDTPVLFIFDFRPDRESPAWRIREMAASELAHRYTEVTLEPLAGKQSAALVANLMKGRGVPQAVRQLVLEKTEGNPLFIEEVIRTLIDRRVLVSEAEGLEWRAGANIDDIILPDNLQAMLSARMDLLPEEVRRTLQLAAVIGRRFLYRVLQIVANADRELDDHLLILERANLIVETARQPEREYMFRNALTQETAYRTILQRRRRTFHLHVGEALEILFPDRIDEYAPQLAQHFDRANDSRALTYYSVAGDAAFRLNSAQDAVDLYSQAMTLATSSGAGGSVLKHLFTHKGRALELLGCYAEAIDLYEEMAAVATARDDRQLELGARVGLATIYAMANAYINRSHAETLARQALTIAQELGDEATETKIWWLLLNVFRFGERVEDAVDAGERGLRLARKHGLEEQLAYLANDLPYIYLSSGRVADALEIVREASALWRKLGNQAMLADSLSSACSFHVFAGEFDQAIALSEEAFAISESIGNSWGQSYSLLFVGQVYWERGDFDRAYDMMQECLKFADLAKFIIPQMWLAPNLGYIYSVLGQPQRGLEIIKQLSVRSKQQVSVHMPMVRALAIYLEILNGEWRDVAARLDRLPGHSATFDAYFQQLIKLIRLRLALHEGDIAAGLAASEEVMKTNTYFSSRSTLPTALYWRARALIAAGQTDEALLRLEEGQHAATEMEMRWQLWPIQALLVELADERGDEATATKLRGDARKTVQYIASHISEASLQRSFLNRPDIHVLFHAEA